MGATRRILAACAGLLAFSAVGASGAHAADVGWTTKALGLQTALGDDVPMRNAQWVGTHNSFNSVAEMGLTLTDQDPNQKVDLATQLNMGLRTLEIDPHWWPSIRDGLQQQVVICHATGPVGCTIEKTMRIVLAEIGGWMRAHPREVLMLYLDDNLDGIAQHDAAVKDIEATIGNLIYRAPGPRQDCKGNFPFSLTRNQVRAAGKQIILVGKCGAGAAYNSLVFDLNSHKIEKGPDKLTAYPGCGGYTRAEYDTKLIRFYEDSTKLSQVTSGGAPLVQFTPATASTAIRCGVDIMGLDQTYPGDPRVDGFIWSWAPGQPAASDVGDCAVQRVDDANPLGRFFVVPCAEKRRAACLTSKGAWKIPVKAVSSGALSSLCNHRASRRAVPRTGADGALLADAMKKAGVSEVLLAYKRVGGQWRALGALRK